MPHEQVCVLKPCPASTLHDGRVSDAVSDVGLATETHWCVCCCCDMQRVDASAARAGAVCPSLPHTFRLQGMAGHQTVCAAAGSWQCHASRAYPTAACSQAPAAVAGWGTIAVLHHLAAGVRCDCAGEQLAAVSSHHLVPQLVVTAGRGCGTALVALPICRVNNTMASYLWLNIFFCCRSVCAGGVSAFHQAEWV